MRCCTSSSIQGTNNFFSKHSEKYLKQFRKKGLAKEQKHLLQGIEISPVSGKSILEIGCGVGGLHLTILKHGASSALGIDISEGMIEGAKQLSKELGCENRTQYILGDVVQANGRITDADIVVLDKVVCCYENVEELLTTSLSKTRQQYALSFPHSNLLVKVSFQCLIVLGKLFRWSFHPYWHDWEKLIHTIQENGFVQTYQHSTFFWSIYVFERHHWPSDPKALQKMRKNL
jgi:2-polyprenyl-3-methyl-5-hydroxy-6-metoxy-1,4-benzoquinol methylase